MAKDDYPSWEKGFVEFMGVQAEEVPETVTAKIIDQISFDLQPSAISVFGKLTLLQFLVGVATLLVCPQFGISLTSSMGLMPYLMKFGEPVCMLGCGGLFAGMSLLVAGFALRPEEVRVLKNSEVLQLVSLATLSLGAFLCVGGEVVLGLGLIWMLGAVIGGAITLEAGWRTRLFLAKRSLA